MRKMKQQLGDTEESVPRPDPTVLTTQQLNTAIDGLREVMFTRLDGNDKAVALLSSNFNRVPTDTDVKVGALKELVFTTFNEKLGSVQLQLKERDTRVEQTAKDAKAALDAALSAAEKAVGKSSEAFGQSIAKSELAVQKQIDLIGQTMQAEARASYSKIDDIKERLTRLEGEDRGQKTAETQQQTSATSTVGIIGLVIGTLIGIGGLIVATFVSRGSP